MRRGTRSAGKRFVEQRRQAGAVVRIIVSPAFRKVGAKDNWEISRDTLDAFGLVDCLRALSLDYFTHCHNKGVLIDRKIAVVSSTNWSKNSIEAARETGFLIESKSAAGYYSQVFDLDWSELSWPQADVPENLMRVVRESLFVPGGERGSVGNERLEPAPEHPLAVEGHRLGIHHVGQAWILHGLGVDPVPMRPGLVDDEGEHHRLVGLELDATRERRPLAPLHVVGDAFDVLEGAVVAPYLTGPLGHAAVGRELLLRDRQNVSIDISSHICLLDNVRFGTELYAHPSREPRRGVLVAALSPWS
jgi:hypothetical protein